MSSETERSKSSYQRSTSYPFDHIDQRTVDMTDICEELLGTKMNSLELNEVMLSAMQCHRQQSSSNQFCDGSDSGVDIATTTMNAVSLQRALSNNSGGYASSNCGGLDEITTCGINGNMSCDSSMISFSSDICELKSMPTNIAECYSENGSESSSVAGTYTDGQIDGGASSSTIGRKFMSSVKKKVALFEPHIATDGKPNAKNAWDKGIHSLNSTPTSSTAGQLGSSSRIRNKVVGITRTASLTRHNSAASAAPLLQTRERARSREKCMSSVPASSTSITKLQSTARSTPLRPKPTKPDSLPSPLTTTTTPLAQRMVQRTPSLSRARTPGTPTDDGRWPSSLNNRAGSVSKRGLSATPDIVTTKMRASMLSMDAKAVNPYGTMPRRRKQKSVEDLTGGRSSRSSSTSREPITNPRMVSSVIGLSSRKSITHSYNTPTSHSSNTTKMLPPATSRSKLYQPPPPPQVQHRTKIYHETSAQTAITSQDLENILAGTAPLMVAVDAIEMHEKQTQADIRDKEMERLHDEIRMLAQRESELATKLHERTQRTSQLELQLKKEREEKITIQRELHLNTERVMGMLELARVSGTPDEDVQCDSLLMLESQIQMSGHELIENQEEISKLRKLCRTLQVEMERSLLAQESLLQEKEAIEQESNELQDFLQHEKAAMCDALKELETEYQTCKQLLENKDEEIKVLRDECRHLVRLNEQRRQENRLMQSKYAALETKSKEFITQQNTAVSGASMSLLGLHSRLDSLVEQLVSSYNISEQDLEDMVFPNEAVAASNNITSCNEMSTIATSTTQEQNSNGVQTSYAQLSDGSLSPQRNQSFIAAVISAIRHATTPSGKKLLSRSRKPMHNDHTTNGEDSDSTTEMLDSETEPCCLMMDNVLEDVTMPDSHSHNMVSSTGGVLLSSRDPPQSEIPHGGGAVVCGDESLQNLSQAITNCQQIELQINSLSMHKVSMQQYNQRENSVSEDISCHDSVAEMPSLAEYCSAQSVVDQVIEVDNIVTKLLKVLRLIQMDNDSCIQQLILDKNKLQQNKEDNLEKLKDLQDINSKLQDDLMDATQELLLKKSDLSNSKAEIQRHRNEIDRLTEDICNLSTLCSNYKKLSPTTESQNELLQQQNVLRLSDDENLGVLNLLRMWEQEGQLRDTNVRSYLLGVLQNTSQECNANSHQNLELNGKSCIHLHGIDMENVHETQLALQIGNVQMNPKLLKERDTAIEDNINANEKGNNLSM